MKSKAGFALVLMLLAIIAMDSTCVAEFSMISPPPTETNTYSDADMTLVFEIDRYGIHMRITNHNTAPLRVNWDLCSYVDFMGGSHRTVEGSTRIIHSELAQPPSVIPPGAYANLLAYPPDFLISDSPGPIYPSSIKDGDNICLYLSIEIGDRQFEKMFTFVFSIPPPAPPEPPSAKSLFTAAAFAYIFPGLGHSYAGNPDRGVNFLVVETVLRYIDFKMRPDSSAPPGWARKAYLCVKYIEYIDAAMEADKWNKANGFAIIPKADGVMVTWSFTW